MTHDQDHDDALDGLDLHLWQVPPPMAVDRAALLGRALAPAAAPPRRRARDWWIVAAIVMLNAAVVTLILMLTRPSVPAVETVQAPAGGSVDAQVRELLQRLDTERRELERRLAEIEELRALVVELSEKVRRHEGEHESNRQRLEQGDRTVPRQPERPAVAPVERPPANALDRCDEVSCVLGNYRGACCTKYRPPGVPMPPDDPPPSTLPEVLDRAAITNGMAGVKARVKACASRSTAKGIVKISVRVDGFGVVTSVTVKQSPDPALGTCVVDQVSRAVFPPTQMGGSFGYPFVF